MVVAVGIVVPVVVVVDCFCHYCCCTGKCNATELLCGPCLSISSSGDEV